MKKNQINSKLIVLYTKYWQHGHLYIVNGSNNQNMNILILENIHFYRKYHLELKCRMINRPKGPLTEFSDMNIRYALIHKVIGSFVYVYVMTFLMFTIN